MKMVKKGRFRSIAEAIYEHECKRLGKKAECWETHEKDCINYWEEVLRRGERAWWKKRDKK
jgi:hypothetical protein